VLGDLGAGMTRATNSVAGSESDSIPSDIILPEDYPPPFRNLFLAVQHVLAMFGATVLGPLLMGFNPNTAILFSGVATLIFYAFLYERVPSYLGSSFSFIAAVNLATGFSGQPGIANPNIAIALGGIVAAGAIYFLIGAIVSRVGYQWLERLMPPVVTGAIVAVIGLNLAPVAVKEISGSMLDTAFGLLTIALVIFCTVIFRGFLGKIPILIGGTLSCVAYAWACQIKHLGLLDFSKLTPMDISKVLDAPWFGLPVFTLPHFDERAIFLIVPVAIVLVAENFGHVRAISAMTNRNLDPYLGRTFMADGLATVISGMFGGTGVTTYAENMGVMSLSKNFSTYTLLFAGVIAICLGLSPKFGELVRIIPVPIIGGLSCILFGLITATAGRIWADAHVDFTQPRALLVVGVTLVLGAGNLTWQFGEFAFGGIATATFTALILYHVIARARGQVTPIMRG
jgi:putative pyrimidine permease RutG